MGERLLCKQEVIGSIPFTSTIGVEWPGTGPWPFPALELSGAGSQAAPGGTGQEPSHRETALPGGAVR